MLSSSRSATRSGSRDKHSKGNTKKQPTTDEDAGGLKSRHHHRHRHRSQAASAAARRDDSRDIELNQIARHEDYTPIIRELDGADNITGQNRPHIDTALPCTSTQAAAAAKSKTTEKKSAAKKSKQGQRPQPAATSRQTDAEMEEMAFIATKSIATDSSLTAKAVKSPPGSSAAPTTAPSTSTSATQRLKDLLKGSQSSKYEEIKDTSASSSTTTPGRSGVAGASASCESVTAKKSSRLNFTDALIARKQHQQDLEQQSSLVGGDESAHRFDAEDSEEIPLVVASGGAGVKKSGSSASHQKKKSSLGNAAIVLLPSIARTAAGAASVPPLSTSQLPASGRNSKSAASKSDSVDFGDGATGRNPDDTTTTILSCVGAGGVSLLGSSLSSMGRGEENEGFNKTFETIF